MKDNETLITARPLFPLFETYLSMVLQEVEGMGEKETDWISPYWGWSGWSIKDNLSHVASHLFRWYILRWGSQLFPHGLPFARDIHYLAGLESRRLDRIKWGTMEKILCKLEQSLELIKHILDRESPSSIFTKTIIQGNPGSYGRIAGRYPGTQYKDPEVPKLWHLTLAGTLHHSEGELVTHLFNVQRLKLAQGLQATTDLPNIGYWTLPDWDKSMP